jgi:hypothetical protein
VVLFGGAAGDDYLQGTQEYDGQSWKEIRFAGAQPSHRAMHAMGYDPVRKQVVLYGGYTGGRFGHSDTWLYRGDGVNGFWNSVESSATSPGAAMVLDTWRNVLILHGGNWDVSHSDHDQESSRETYEWDGQKWNLAAFGARVYGFGMAFDDRRGVAVTVGGFGHSDEADRTDHVWQYAPGAGWASRYVALLPFSMFPVLSGSFRFFHDLSGFFRTPSPQRRDHSTLPTPKSL